MDGVFFSGENLLYSAYLFAGNHVQVAVVDRRAGGDIVAVVVGNEGEVDGVIAGGGKVIGSLLGGGEGLFQAIDLLGFFVELLLRDPDGDVELGNFGD